MMRRAGHAFTVATLQKLDVNELREATIGVVRGSQPSPADAAREWLLAQDLDRRHAQQVEQALQEFGHAFDEQTLERIGIGELRAALAAQRSQRSRGSSSAAIRRHLSEPGDARPERDEAADPCHPYNNLRRQRLAVLVALHGHANIANYKAGQPFHNCPEGLDDCADEIRTLPRESLFERFKKAEDFIGEWQSRWVDAKTRDASDPVGQGGVTISSCMEGGARIKLRDFDIAEFSPLSAKETFVPETIAIILDLDDAKSALTAEGESLVGKIVVIDMHVRPNKQGTTPQWGLFPCEYAYAAQQAGACGVIFVYSSSQLRGTMRSLHRKTHSRAIHSYSLPFVLVSFEFPHLRVLVLYVNRQELHGSQRLQSPSPAREVCCSGRAVGRSCGLTPLLLVA
jgi:hypothetical protein